MSNLLNIGRQALNANSVALNYVGQNIANVNTEGYSRQEVTLAERGGKLNGVVAEDVRRMTNTFMAGQVWRDKSALGADEVYAEKMQFLDAIVGSTSANISDSIDKFFAATQRVADDPMLNSNRQVFLSAGKELVSKFNSINTKIEEQNDTVNDEIKNALADVNTIVSKIAKINGDIEKLVGMDKASNQLLDERDKLVDKLSSLVNVSIQEDPKGGINITMGGGEPLLVGTEAALMEARPSSSNSQSFDIFLAKERSEYLVSDQITGGKIAGLRFFQEDVLVPAKNEFGRMAIVFAETMNEQHRKGLDASGNLAGDLFSEMQGGNIVANANNGAVNVATAMKFYDVSELSASAYEVELKGFDPVGNLQFEVVRQSDGARFDQTDFTEFGSLPAGDTAGMAQGMVYQQATDKIKFSMDGFTVEISPSAMVRGDKFMVEPTVNGAKQIQMEINNPRKVGVASIVGTRAHEDNQGVATISPIRIDSTLDSTPLRSGTAQLPLTVVMNGPDATGQNTISLFQGIAPATTAVTGYQNIAYNDGDEIAIDGYRFTIDGTTVAGDEFILAKNTDAVGDNQNFLEMGNLQMEVMLEGGTIQEAYGELLAWVGTRSSTAQLSYTASQSSLSVSEGALENYRGVNLDEEASNLIKYQQAYAASAQVITAHQTIFNALLSAVGG